MTRLNAVLNAPDLREAHNICLPLLSAWQTDLAQNEALCRACQRIADTEQTLDGTQRRVLEHQLREFRLAGVALEPARKARVFNIKRGRGAGRRCQRGHGVRSPVRVSRSFISPDAS